MITILFLVILGGAVIGGIYIAVQSGKKGKGSNMAGSAAQQEQMENTKPPRSTGSGND